MKQHPHVLQWALLLALVVAFLASCRGPQPQTPDAGTTDAGTAGTTESAPPTSDAPNTPEAAATAEKPDVPAPALTYGKKYILLDGVKLPEEQQEYLIFEADGTGIYRYYGEGIGGGTYQIRFRYFIIGNQLHCFYDRLLSDPALYEYKIDTFWFRSYTYSEQLIFSDSLTYLCETFLPQIPNYGEPLTSAG